MTARMMSRASGRVMARMRVVRWVFELSVAPEEAFEEGMAGAVGVEMKVPVAVIEVVAPAVDVMKVVGRAEEAVLEEVAVEGVEASEAEVAS